MSHPWSVVDAEGVTLLLRVQPGAKAFGITGRRGDQLKVAVPAPPVDGKANKALIRGLADLLGVRRSQVALASGQSSRDKKVRVQGDPTRILAGIVAALAR